MSPSAPLPEAAGARRTLAADLAIPVAAARELVADLAEEWGGELARAGSGEGDGGRLALPVAAGLRHGLLEAEVVVRRLGEAGSRVELTVERERYRLHVAAVVVLLIGAAGGLFLMLAPLLLGGRALAALPAAFFVMLAAWFLVVSRIRHRGAAEFLADLAAASEGPASSPARK